MLTVAENEKLTRVGPGTPMGVRTMVRDNPAQLLGGAHPGRGRAALTP